MGRAKAAAWALALERKGPADAARGTSAKPRADVAAHAPGFVLMPRGKGGVGRAKAAAWALALERKNPAFFAANNINLLRARHWEGHAQGEAR